MNGFIYKITNKVNNKIYIGKTMTSIEKRFQEHIRESRKKRAENRPLYRAIRKYGKENFAIELVESCPIEILSDREIYWIDYFSSYKEGYNATLGGDGRPSYDYNVFVKEFLSGKNIRDIAKEYGCCEDTVSAAVNLAGLDAHKNAHLKQIKGLSMRNSEGKLIETFVSRSQAADWIIQNGYSEASKEKVIIAIGRAANHKRKSAYGFIWDNI